MSWLGINSQILGRCSSCLASQVPVAPVMRTNVLYRHGLRYASTAAKPRAKKTDSAASELASAVAKKKISTKTATTTAAKPRGRKKAEPPAEGTLSDAPAPVAKKTTRSASTKSTAAATKKKAELDAVEDKPASTRAKTTAATRARKSAAAAATQPAITPIPHAPSPPPKTPDPARFTDKSTPAGVTGTTAGKAPQPPPPETMVPPPEPIKVVDTSGPEYKRAARKYTSVMVALPILLVTSYFLFDRLVLGNEVKKFEAPPSLEPLQDKSTPES